MPKYSTAKIKYVISEEHKIALKTVLQAQENSVSKDVIKEKIEELNNKIKNLHSKKWTKYSSGWEILWTNQLEILQELLK